MNIFHSHGRSGGFPNRPIISRIMRCVRIGTTGKHITISLEKDTDFSAQFFFECVPKLFTKPTVKDKVKCRLQRQQKYCNFADNANYVCDSLFTITDYNTSESHYADIRGLANEKYYNYAY
jgi:hypothetical protein